MQIPGKCWIVVLISLLAGCTHGPPPQRFQYVQLLMGVQVRVVTYAPSEPVAKNAAKAAFERVAELEDIMSDYRPDSELMQLCARAGSGPVPVSKELFEVLAYGQEVSRLSDGAFDVTVGPYVKLWRQARKTKTLPDPSALADAKRRVGWRLMKLDPKHQTVDLTVPGMLLDLGGIAKGYAGDEAIKVLRDHGINSGLFEAGGDIVVSNAPPGKEGWDIELIGLGVSPERNLSHSSSGETPKPQSDKPFDGVVLHDAAISTSGDTVQFVEINGVRYSHVIDPRTGLGLTEHRMATVIAPRGITTDSQSKAVTILPEPDGAALLKRYHARGYVRKVEPQ
jgi:thiamine biosynthesis lipoprotein